MQKNITQNTSLASCLRIKPRQKTHFKDSSFDIFKVSALQLKYRKKVALLCFAAAMILSFSNPAALQNLSLPTLLTRLEMGGFIFAAVPLLAIAYIIERVVSLNNRVKGQISPLYSTIFIAPPLIVTALDSGALGAPYNILNLFFFAAATALLWPSKKRRSYYTKKHIDKRTK